eukprot:1685409-Rhodomonas_salina.1
MLTLPPSADTAYLEPPRRPVRKASARNEAVVKYYDRRLLELYNVCHNRNTDHKVTTQEAAAICEQAVKLRRQIYEAFQTRILSEKNMIKSKKWLDEVISELSQKEDIDTLLALLDEIL